MEPGVSAHQRRQLLENAGIDYLRLNWKRGCRDELAALAAPNLTWADGRNRLFLEVKGDYDYYIFSDDDIELTSTAFSPFVGLRTDLERWSPLTGTVRSYQDWAQRRTRSMPLKKAVRIAAHDQQVQIVSGEVADAVLPGPFSGAHASMWHIQMTGFTRWQNRQLLLPTESATNINSLGHEHERLHSTFTAPEQIMARLKQDFDYLNRRSRSSIVKYRNWVVRRNLLMALIDSVR